MENRKAIVEYIRQIEVQEKTGSLYLIREPSDPQDSWNSTREVIHAYFQLGLLAAISSSLPEYRIGQYFLKEGLIDPPELHQLLKQPDRRPLGEKLVEADFADPLDVKQLVYRQALELFKRALEEDFRVETFEPMSVSFQIPLRLDLSSLLLDLARQTKQTFSVNSHNKICLTAERDFSTLPWQPEEVATLDQLNEPRELDELLEATGLPQDQMRRILNTFLHLGIAQVLSPETTRQTTALVRKERFPFELLVPEVRDALFSEQLETARNAHSFASEQFATLKVRLKEPRSGNPVRVIAVTSPNVEDGKSLVGANLAFSFAKDQGRRAIVVDCDLRRPALHTYVGIPLEPGLIGYLSNNLLKPYCFMRRVGSLYLMTAGGTAENPVELLSLRKMRELVQYLKTEFDIVILDSPPLNPISDTRIISSFADGLILVVRRGKTPYALIEKALSAVDRKKLLGAVFNDVKPVMFHTYYNYSYYSYGKETAYPYGRDSHRRERRRR